MAGETEKRKLKIAVLVRHFVTSGGMERYAVEITRRLKDRGHEIHLFCREFDESLARDESRIKLSVRPPSFS